MDAGRRLAPVAARLDRRGGALLPEARERLARAGRLLETLSHRSTLARGFAVLRSAEGEVITSAGAVAPGAGLRVELRDGVVDTVATSGGATVTPAPAPAPKRKPRKSPKDGGEGQGSLF
jgi:exodeoxyribonuclease VII large subunit